MKRATGVSSRVSSIKSAIVLKSRVPTKVRGFECHCGYFRITEAVYYRCFGKRRMSKCHPQRC